VKSYVQPSPATVAAFTSFASAQGVTSTVISPHGEWVSIALSVSQANALFGAHFEKFSNPEMSAPLTRTLSISLPEELVGHVEVLHPTTAFDRPSMRADRRFSATERRVKRRRRAVPPDSCKAADDSLTPACLQTLYGIPTTPATQTSSTLLVTGYTEQWAQRADLVVRTIIVVLVLPTKQHPFPSPVEIPSGFPSRHPAQYNVCVGHT
jgi:tripeptidyl-peptidase-1